MIYFLFAESYIDIIVSKIDFAKSSTNIFVVATKFWMYFSSKIIYESIAKICLRWVELI